MSVVAGNTQADSGSKTVSRKDIKQGISAVGHLAMNFSAYRGNKNLMRLSGKMSKMARTLSDASKDMGDDQFDRNALTFAKRVISAYDLAKEEMDTYGDKNTTSAAVKFLEPIVSKWKKLGLKGE